MSDDFERLAEDWLAGARARLDRAELGAKVEFIGRVEEVEDGVALVSGLPDVGLDELLRFDGGQFGFAQTLERDRVGCVLLDEAEAVEAGDAVRGTGDVVRVPVGEALLGRIVDPLGRPIDGGGPIAARSRADRARRRPHHRREPVTEPVQTGVLVVDALFALGRGQRELIIGDRAIGKTTLAVDAIIAQKTSDIVCVYVAVGQKTSSVRRAIDAIQAHGDPSRCIFVVAEAASPPGLQWIAPFAGFTMAEYFRDRGRHALIVVDDLSKHAATHREIALLTRQSPGREAYPGDVFYVHARLLERAAKLSAAQRRRLADRAADRRDRRRQPDRLYPDQPDLDRRRPDRARRAAVQRGPQAGGRRRPLGQPRRRQDPGARAAGGGRDAAARLRAVPRTRNLHPLRRHVRRAGARAVDARRAHPRRARPAAPRAAAARRRSGADARRAVRACSIRCRSRRWRRSATPCRRRSTAARRRSSTTIETTGNLSATTRRALARSCRPKRRPCGASGA